MRARFRRRRTCPAGTCSLAVQAGSHTDTLARCARSLSQLRTWAGAPAAQHTVHRYARALRALAFFAVARALRARAASLFKRGRPQIRSRAARARFHSFARELAPRQYSTLFIDTLARYARSLSPPSHVPCGHVQPRCSSRVAHRYARALRALAFTAAQAHFARLLAAHQCHRPFVGTLARCTLHALAFPTWHPPAVRHGAVRSDSERRTKLMCDVVIIVTTFCHYFRWSRDYVVSS